MKPNIRYARSGDVSIAYQVVGDGPTDLVMVFGYVSNIEVNWEEPMLARFLERLSRYGRLIVFDKRGTGLSDRVSEVPSLEVRPVIALGGEWMHRVFEAVRAQGRI